MQRGEQKQEYLEGRVEEAVEGQKEEEEEEEEEGLKDAGNLVEIVVVEKAVVANKRMMLQNI